MVVVDFFCCFFGYWLVFGFCLDLCLVSMVVVDFYFFGWFFGWLVFVFFCLVVFLVGFIWNYPLLKPWKLLSRRNLEA